MRHGDRLAELSAHLDGELLPEEMAAVREHLAACAECTAEYETLRAVSDRVRSQIERPVLPATLRARIEEAARRSVGADDDQPPHRPALPAPGRGSWLTRIAAGLLIAAVSAGTSATLVRQRSARASVATEVMASHLRSLMPGHLTDVASNDTHNVKPWFNGRLDLSPDVPRLDSLGFPLVGGRLDYLGGRPVAVVVYMRRQHVINVFSWPVEHGREGGRSMVNEKGYHLIRWTSRDAEYWVASDVNPADLTRFVDLFTQNEAAPREP
jgi:anti-sigma factor RsiW